MQQDPMDSVRFHKLSGGDPESFSHQFFVLINDALNQNANTNGSKPAAVQGDHLVHFNEMAAAFERLTTLVQAQQTALAKIDQNDDRILRKVNLFVEGQPSTRLSKMTKLFCAMAAVSLVGIGVLLGVWWDQSSANSRIAVDHATSLAYVRDIVHSLQNQAHPSPSVSPTGYASKPAGQ